MTLTKQIQAFLPGWAPSNEYLKIRYDLITSIIWSLVYVKGDGSLNYLDYGNPNNTISYSHSQGIPVTLSFMPYSKTDADILLASPTARTVAINNIFNEVKNRGFDGVDTDIEMKISSANWNNMYKSYITAFQTELANKFWNDNPNYRVTMDISGYYPNTDKLYDVPTLQNYTNYIMVMGYPWNGEWSTNAASISWHTDDTGNIGNYPTILHYKGQMNKEKLLFGVPYYGKEFATVSDARMSAVNGPVINIDYDEFIDNVPSYTRYYDSIWQTPWYTRQVGTQWYQGHYDDVQSLSQKYDVVNSEGLAGIGIWDISMTTDRPELWNLLQSKFVCSEPIANLELI